VTRRTESFKLQRWTPSELGFLSFTAKQTEWNSENQEGRDIMETREMVSCGDFGERRDIFASLAFLQTVDVHIHRWHARDQLCFRRQHSQEAILFC
jgi:hypothetical protein